MINVKQLSPFIDFYMKNLDEMLKNHNYKWVVIGQNELEGKAELQFWDNQEDASFHARMVYFGDSCIMRQVHEKYSGHGRFGMDTVYNCDPTRFN